jgi:hypothetical protein
MPIGSGLTGVSQATARRSPETAPLQRGNRSRSRMPTGAVIRRSFDGGDSQLLEDLLRRASDHGHRILQQPLHLRCQRPGGRTHGSHSPGRRLRSQFRQSRHCRVASGPHAAENPTCGNSFRRLAVFRAAKQHRSGLGWQLGDRQLHGNEVSLAVIPQHPDKRAHRDFGMLDCRRRSVGRGRWPNC